MAGFLVGVEIADLSRKEPGPLAVRKNEHTSRVPGVSRHLLELQECLRFISKRAFIHRSGLLTIAAMLPEAWQKNLWI
jgi:hypothetical protein